MSMNTSRERALQEQLDWFDNESEMGRSPLGASLRQSIVVDHFVDWMSYDWKKYNILNKKKLNEIEMEILEHKRNNDFSQPIFCMKKLRFMTPRQQKREWETDLKKLESKKERLQYGKWEEITITRPGWPRYATKAQRRKFDEDWHMKNQPLIQDGLAERKLGDRVLVTGYILRSNPKIYKPVFQEKRERYYYKLKNELKKNGRFIAAEFREALYFKTLMDIPELNIIPEVIIMVIIKLTVDPYTYLSS